MAKTIVIVGTLDTKAEEISYVKKLIEQKGHNTIIIDTSTLDQAPFDGDVTPEQVSRAASSNREQVIALGEGEAISIMAKGAANIAKELHASGDMDGIIALGGSMGTTVGLAVMNALPLVMPKLMVSTVAFTPTFQSDSISKDLTVMPTVTDLWGLNRITRRVLEHAAGAITGMVEAHQDEVSSKPLVGVTTLGSAALKYAPHIKPLLEEKGYEVMIFHTNSVGGPVFEQFVEQGLLVGALDLSMLELMNFIHGTPWAANRLEAVAKRHIPYVVAPGASNWLSWAGTEKELPLRLRGRKTHMHNPQAVEFKATKEEMATTGEIMARKLNKALGPTVVLIPTRGFSERDRPGAVFYDLEANEALIEALKNNLEPKIDVIELDTHIDDPEFAQAAVAILDGMMRKGEERAAVA